MRQELSATEAKLLEKNEERKVRYGNQDNIVHRDFYTSNQINFIASVHVLYKISMD